MLDAVDLVLHSRAGDALQAVRRGEVHAEGPLHPNALVWASALATWGFCPEAHRLDALRSGAQVSSRERGDLRHAARSARSWGRGTVAVDAPPRVPVLVFDQPGLCGKPDAVRRVRRGVFGYELRPCELKTGTPDGDQAGPALQLMAQGLLLEDLCGRYPAFGYLQYAGYRLARVRLGWAARVLVLEVLRAIHDGRSHPSLLPRDARCFGCRHRRLCGVAALAE